jgi:hypothetical protein
MNGPRRGWFAPARPDDLDLLKPDRDVSVNLLIIQIVSDRRIPLLLDETGFKW